jgi:hypothetical protein
MGSERVYTFMLWDMDSLSDNSAYLTLADNQILGS